MVKKTSFTDYTQEGKYDLDEFEKVQIEKRMEAFKAEQDEAVRFTIPLPPITKKNSQRIFVNGKTGKPFIMPIGSKYFVINGGGYKNDVAPIIVEDRTLIPIRVVAENLNCKVSWNSFTREVNIKAL